MNKYKKILKTILPLIPYYLISIPVCKLIESLNISMLFQNICLTALLIVPSVTSLTVLKKELKNINKKIYESKNSNLSIEKELITETKTNKKEINNSINKYYQNNNSNKKIRIKKR